MGLSRLPTPCRFGLGIAAAGFEPAPTPHFFSTDVRQISPTLNDDLLELYGRAGQVLANRFAFFNSPQAFDEGIDWEPPQTPSWRAELHACDYAFDLACTFRISGEEVYARQLRYLIAHWIASNPPGSRHRLATAGLARRMRNWMLCRRFCPQRLGARRGIREAWWRKAWHCKWRSCSANWIHCPRRRQGSTLPAPSCAPAAFSRGARPGKLGQSGFELLASELAGSPRGAVAARAPGKSSGVDGMESPVGSRCRTQPS